MRSLLPGQRKQEYYTYRILTSPLLVVPTGLLLGGAALSVPLLAAKGFDVSNLLLGTVLTAAGIGLGGFILIMFALTHIPQHPRKKPSSVSEDVGGDRAEVESVASLNSLTVLERLPATATELTEDFIRATLAHPAAYQMAARLELPKNYVKTIAQTFSGSFSVSDYLRRSMLLARELDASSVDVPHLAAALLIHPQLHAYLRGINIREEDVLYVMQWMVAQAAVRAEAKRWWRKERLLGFTGIGLSWVTGFTPLIDRFSRIPPGNLWDVVTPGRKPLVEQLIATLARERQSNVLLVGQPGVGRLGIIHAMADAVRKNRAHPALNGQRVVYLHVGELLAVSNQSAGQLALIGQALREMEQAGNIIAVIDGLSSILGGASDTLDFTDVLLPFFSSLTVRVVVIMSAAEYHERVRDNEELTHFFEVIQVAEATPEDTTEVLTRLAPALEQSSGLYLPYKTLRALVRATTGVLQNIPYPERAFDVLEEAIVVAQQKGKKVLEATDVEELITRKVGVPVGGLEDEERARLLTLQETMHQRIVNQRPAVEAVAKAMLRARAEVRGGTRPIGTFLFLGPTGVGKTETAKTLAGSYFGSRDKITRFDMSEFSGPDGVAALIGGKGYESGRLTSQIIDTPFTVLLLDEFEKASRSVHQLFLQVFDEGKLTDSRGHEVSFQHTIIIATSNAGTEYIRQHIDEAGSPDFSAALTDHILEEGIYAPELLNRFDGVIAYTPLTPEHVREIAQRMLQELNEQLDREHGITIAVTEGLLDTLVSIGYNPEFGARPMKRAIQDTVEYLVAQRIVAGVTTPGQVLDVTGEVKART